jgi:membrane associated rhomboid family serine protease
MFRSNRSTGLNPVFVLIGVTVVIYLAQMFDQNGEIEKQFALSTSDWLDRPWTLITYMFLHGTDSSLFSTHLIFNMLALYFFSAFVIALVGETAFLLTYFAGGVVGGLMYILFSYIPMPLIQAHYSVVGASGAIYALGGLLMIMRPNARVLMFFIIPMPLWVAILIGFLIITPGVAWQAHLGGLVYGVLVGWYYRRREIRRF